ncbi:MAG: CPBP family intramembrane metalloprotease [Actinomycetota bacterium]|nr:CPBP family intramembrane metalloprotease [Actinomycetota bacterium]
MSRSVTGIGIGGRRPAAGGPDRAPMKFRLWPPVVLFYVVALLAAGVLQLVAAWTNFHPQAWSLPQFGPAIAVGVVLAVFPSLRGLVAATFTGRRAGLLRQLGLVAGTTALVFAGYIGIYAGLGQRLAVLPLHDLTAPLLIIVPLAFVGACGEELGWRCLLQPLLRRRYSTIATSSLVGLLWAVWHVQVFTQGISIVSAFVIWAVAMSVIMGLAIERSGGHNLLIAATLHALTNLGTLFLAGDDASGDATDSWAFALVWALAAAGWVLADARSRRPITEPR